LSRKTQLIAGDDTFKQLVEENLAHLKYILSKFKKSMASKMLKKYFTICLFSQMLLAKL